MAGTLFGIGLSQQHDANGVPMAGCLLYVYQANTSTPVTTYKDPGLTVGQEHSHPIVADANGRIPAFWVANGSYRARLTDADGVVQFDESSIVAIGAGGDVTVDSTPAEAIFTTGDVCWRPVNTTKAGWVRMNGRTIGNTASGASELADDDDANALYLYIYANFANTICPVSGGRTGNAQNDFDANKTIQLIDMRARSAWGADDMGNSAAGFMTFAPFTNGSEIIGGAHGGQNHIILTQAQLPSVSLTTTIPAGTLTHGHPGSTAPVSSTGVQYGGGGLGPPVGTTGTTALTIADWVQPVASGTWTPLGGSASGINNLPGFVIGTWYWRL